ncbi:MAG: hypothetical protein PVG78_09515 [Desulfobacterales bacterium]|jgi:hypothetical protein
MKPAATKALLAFTAAVLIAAAGCGLFLWHARHRVFAMVDAIAGGVPGVASIDVGGVHTDLFGGGIQLEQLTVRLASGKEPIRIASAEILDADRRHPVPRWMHVALHGIELHPAIHLPEVSALIPSGVAPEPLIVNLEAVYRYRADSRQLDLQRLFLGSEKLGEISIAGRFDNLDLERTMKGPVQFAEMIGAVTGARIRDAAFTYQDHDLVRETIRRRAQRRGMPPERYARLLVKMLRLRGEGEPKGLLDRTLAPLAEFLSDPDTLRISVHPPQPVPFGWLLWVRDPKRLIELLGLRIEA